MGEFNNNIAARRRRIDAREPGSRCEPLQSIVNSIYVQQQPSGRGSAWLERLVRDQEVGGSNPLAPTTSFKISDLLHQIDSA